MEPTLTQIDRQFLNEAFAERQRSEDPKAATSPSSGVGAIISRDNKIISRSANVIPPPINKLNANLKNKLSSEDRYIYIEHAERAAILKAFTEGERLSGATMYCTRFPCTDCARAIVWSGIQKLIVGTKLSQNDKWYQNQKSAVQVLRSAGIEVIITDI